MSSQEKGSFNKTRFWLLKNPCNARTDAMEPLSMLVR